VKHKRDAGGQAGVAAGKAANDRGLLVVLAEALFSVPRVRQAVLMTTATATQQASSRVVLALQNTFMAMSKAPHIDQLVPCYFSYFSISFLLFSFSCFSICFLSFLFFLLSISHSMFRQPRNASQGNTSSVLCEQSREPMPCWLQVERVHIPLHSEYISKECF